MQKVLSLVALAVCFASLLAGCGSSDKPAVKGPDKVAPAKGDKIAEALAELSPEDRKLAEEQKFCAVANESRLGGMGTPYKVTIKGQTVFLCCDGCEKDALADEEKTLANVEKLKLANK